MPLLHGAEVPGPWFQHRRRGHFDRIFQRLRTGREDDLTEAVGDFSGDAVVVPVEDHDVHSVIENVGHQSGKVLYRNCLVDYGQILFLHVPAEVLHLG